MITIEKLKEFKSALEDCMQQCNELIRMRPAERLFTNSDDYYISLKSCEYCPQDYYKIRLFDTEATLRYSKRDKKFYFHIETVKYDFLRKTAFNDFLSQNKLKRVGVEDNNFMIPSNTSFGDVVKLFYKLCLVISSLYLGEEKLFIYS